MMIPLKHTKTNNYGMLAILHFLGLHQCMCTVVVELQLYMYSIGSDFKASGHSKNIFKNGFVTRWMHDKK